MSIHLLALFHSNLSELFGVKLIICNLSDVAETIKISGLYDNL